LRKSGFEGVEEINYAKAPLSADVVEGLVALAGGVAAVINTRHAIAKEKGWVASPPTARVFAEAVAKEPNLLKRPILVVDDARVIVGFDKAAYQALKP
jgi:arsenate reductase-like glutaredoxin family protein